MISRQRRVLPAVIAVGYMLKMSYLRAGKYFAEMPRDNAIM